MSNSKIRMLPLEKNSVSKSNFAELRFKIKIVLKLFIDIRDRVIYTHRKWEREREGCFMYQFTSQMARAATVWVV